MGVKRGPETGARGESQFWVSGREKKEKEKQKQPWKWTGIVTYLPVTYRIPRLAHTWFKAYINRYQFYSRTI